MSMSVRCRVSGKAPPVIAGFGPRVGVWLVVGGLLVFPCAVIAAGCRPRVSGWWLVVVVGVV